MPHKVRSERSPVDHGFVINVSAYGVGLGWQLRDGRVATAEIVLGVAVDAACVGDEDVQTTPFVPDGLEEG